MEDSELENHFRKVVEVNADVATKMATSIDQKVGVRQYEIKGEISKHVLALNILTILTMFNTAMIAAILYWFVMG